MSCNVNAKEARLKYYLLLFLLIATVPSPLYSQQDKLPKYEIKHYSESDKCSSVCDQTQLTNFGKLLTYMSQKATDGLNNEVCNDEKMKQAKRSVDFMEGTEKALNCCLMNKFCSGKQSNFEELYSIEWKSTDVFCGQQKVTFQVELQDCYTYDFL